MSDPTDARAHQVAHLILDALVASTPLPGEPTAPPGARPMVDVLTTAFTDVGELLLLARDDAGDVRLDLTPLVYGAVNLTHCLAAALAEEVGVSVLDVVSSARQQVDGWQTGPPAT